MPKRVVAVWMTTVALLVVSSCRSAEEPIVMKRIELGRAVDERGAITDPTRTFGPRDTVYASIGTTGTAAARLHVEWRSGGKPLGSEVRDVHPDGPTEFAFHFSPPEGWPIGRAQVIFFMDESDKHAAAFEVQ